MPALLPSVFAHKSTTGFTANAWSFYFGGVGDNYLSSGSPLTGVADAYTGTLNIWVKVGAISGAVNNTIINSNFLTLIINATGYPVLTVTDAGSNLFKITSTTAIATGSWYNFLAAWNTNHTAGNKIGTLYINGATSSPSLTDADAAFKVAYTNSNITTPISGINSNMYLSEIWLAAGQFIDFSVSGNRALFYSAGQPVYLGPSGSTPTGTAPTVYINQAAAFISQNQGTGGNFSVFGTITDVPPP